MDVRFITPKQGDIYKWIKKEGYDIHDPYTKDGVIWRIIREIVFCFDLPFKTMFYNHENAYCNKTIIVYEALITAHYLEWLRLKNKNSNIILIYCNPVANRASIKPYLVGNWCEKWTTDYNDSMKYGLNLYANLVYFRCFVLPNNDIQYDILYVGKDKNGRLNMIKKLKKAFDEIGLKSYFHIVANHRYMRYTSIHYKNPLPYEEVLRFIGMSKCILHLIDGGQSGLTMRIAESVIHKKKLITNDKSVANYEFYNKNNIFIIGIDNIDMLKSFVDTPYIDTGYLEKHKCYFDDMVKYIMDGQ